ncbi:MAG TPA: hypothetical protein VE135_21265 [Pyrinomonadaceae bacterium]|nr:hypothetical protein [Pyrinomonadaceae bacterium]
MHLILKKNLWLLVLCIGLTACQNLPLPQDTRAASSSQNSKRPTEIYGPPKVVGQLRAREINESSGLVASQTPGIYWTHNDSGDGPFLYAINERGVLRGVWRVAGANARDWEDIAAGPGRDRSRRFLYVGDIGDNDTNRSEVVVYRVPEPAVSGTDLRSSKVRPQVTEPAEAIKLRYPDGKHDAEALMVHPITGDLYIVTKIAFANPIVYKAPAPLDTGRAIMLIRQGELNVPSLLGGMITGGDISPDGRRVALCDYLQGYELLLPEAAGTFDDIWKQSFNKIDLGKRKQGEAIAFRLDGRALLATSEGVGTPLIEVVRR